MDAPEYMDEFRASVQASPDPKKDSVMVDLAVSSGSVTLLHVFGPTAIALTHSFTKVQTEVTLVTNIFSWMDHFLFAGNFTVRNNGQVVHLKFMKNQHPSFVFMLDTSSLQSDVTIIKTSLILPMYINFGVTFKVTPWCLKFDLKSLLLPELRKVHANVEYVRQSGKAKVSFFWQAHRGHPNVAFGQAAFVQNEPHQPRFSIM